MIITATKGAQNGDRTTIHDKSRKPQSLHTISKTPSRFNKVVPVALI